MITILAIIVLSCCSAYFYRKGGTSDGTLWRDLIVPIIASFALFILGYRNLWGYFIHFGLLFGALTTYWDWLFGEDNYYAHGFACGLALLPFAWFGIAWWVILLRAIILGLSMGLWHKFVTKDVWDERGRGAFLTLSLLIA